MNIDEIVKQALDESMAFTRYLTEKYGPEKGVKIMEVTAEMGRIAQESGVAEASFQEFPRFAAGVLRTARFVSGQPCPVVQTLDNLGGDPKRAHETAVDVVLGHLRELGQAEIADAFIRARDRVGFWYA